MKFFNRSRAILMALGGTIALALGVIFLIHSPQEVHASWLFRSRSCGTCSSSHGEFEIQGAGEGSWYWMRSPEQEKRVIANLYNRYCVRCHGVDGRGVWDIPDVPDFTHARWQASRSDGELARLTLEGRGAVMPAFKGTLTLEEAWAMARYLRSFVPGTGISKPDLKTPKK